MRSAISTVSLSYLAPRTSHPPGLSLAPDRPISTGSPRRPMSTFLTLCAWSPPGTLSIPRAAAHTLLGPAPRLPTPPSCHLFPALLASFGVAVGRQPNNRRPEAARLVHRPLSIVHTILHYLPACRRSSLDGPGNSSLSIQSDEHGSLPLSSSERARKTKVSRSLTCSPNKGSRPHPPASRSTVLYILR